MYGNLICYKPRSGQTQCNRCAVSGPLYFHMSATKGTWIAGNKLRFYLLLHSLLPVGDQVDESLSR